MVEQEESVERKLLVCWRAASSLFRCNVRSEWFGGVKSETGESFLKGPSR